MRRAIVHIGTPRTGTTTLQRILSDRRSDLARAGILYPDLTPASAGAAHLSHQHLGEALGGRRPARERTELLDKLAALLGATECDTVILSYEGLCLIPPAFGTARLLGEVFARHGMAMEIVFTVKPQAEYLNSTYTWRMQFLREARLFPAFLRAHLGGREFDYARLVAPWSAAASGRLRVIPVRDATSAQPLVARILDRFALGDRLAAVIGGDDFALVENRSPGPLAVEICRRLRAGGAALALGPDARSATRFVEQAARETCCDSEPFTGHDDTLRAHVDARWGDANERFAARVWGTGWADRVAPAPPRAPNEIGRQPPSPQTEAAIDDILRRTCAAFGIALQGRAGVRLREAAGLSRALLVQMQRFARGLIRG